MLFLLERTPWINYTGSEIMLLDGGDVLFKYIKPYLMAQQLYRTPKTTNLVTFMVLLTISSSLASYSKKIRRFLGYRNTFLTLIKSSMTFCFLFSIPSIIGFL
jgi:hypothetical protein